MKQSAILTVFLFMLLAAAAGPTNLDAGDLVVGTSTGYPPYYYIEEGKPAGFCVEVVSHAARLLGKQVRYRSYPWKRMLYLGRHGEVDAIMPLFRTPEREQFLVFPDTEVVFEENSFFTRKDTGIRFSGKLKEMQPYPIGIINDYSYGPEFDAAAYLRKIPAKDNVNLLQMFRYGRFPVGVGNRDVIRYFTTEAGGIDDLVFLEPPLTRAALFLAFSRNGRHAELADAFSRALRTFKTTPAYRHIVSRYGITP